MHSVPTRRFVLISADHPLCTAIEENKDQLQTHDIQAMPEQMIKVRPMPVAFSCAFSAPRILTCSFRRSLRHCTTP